MWSEAFDLHNHSIHSDGGNTPDYVAKAMKEAGVKVWSLTDHDTVQGYEEASLAAEKNGLRFVCGVEITCRATLGFSEGYSTFNYRVQQCPVKRSWHLLAYFPNLDIENPSAEFLRFQRWLDEFGSSRVSRMQKIIDKLADLGMPLDEREVFSKATTMVGRPHLADAMVQAGYVKTRQQAFDEWIGDGKPAHVMRYVPTIAEAAHEVRLANGITSLAHPLHYGIEPKRLMRHLVASNIDAVEAFHPDHSNKDRYEFWQAAKAEGLSITAGSDYHDLEHNPVVGKMPIPLADLPAELRNLLVE